MDDFANDPKFRQYQASVDKAVKSFESSSEWADLISCLGKLSKALQTFIQFPVLPRKVTIGKRLAQCLHPALPSGVHIKALETYELVLKRVKSRGLLRDLFVYSSGLFPLMGQAATSVKPLLLSLYENHYLPLGRELLPCLKGLLLAVLPGLEEGSEYYKRVHALLVRLSKETDSVVFFSSLWHCMLYSPHVRLAVVDFALSQLDKSKSAENQAFIVGNDVRVTTLAICTGFSDQNILVLRFLLDVTSVLFPLHLNYPSPNSLTELVAAALTVLLRRDLSLNRRLYAWLCSGGNGTAVQNGDDGKTSPVPSDYFQKFCRRYLIQATRRLLADGVAAGERQSVRDILKPYRIISTLMDRPEIGPVILEDVFFDVLRSLRHHSVEMRREGTAIIVAGRRRVSLADEMTKAANLLFGTFESTFMWNFVSDSLEKAANGKEGIDAVEVIKLGDFLLDTVFMKASDQTSTLHLPELFARVAACVFAFSDRLCPSEVSACLHFCSKVLSKCEPSQQPVIATDTLLRRFSRLGLKLGGPVLLISCCTYAIQSCLIRYADAYVLQGEGDGHPEDAAASVFDALCKLLVEVASFPIFCELSPGAGLDSEISFEWLRCLLTCITSAVNFRVFASATRTYLDLAAIAMNYGQEKQGNGSVNVAVYIKPLMTHAKFEQICQRTDTNRTIVEKLWQFLDCDDENQLQEVASLFSQLSSLSLCWAVAEEVVCGSLTSTDEEERQTGLVRFSRLWSWTEPDRTKPSPSFERSLFIVVENLHGSDPVTQQTTRAWLSHLLQQGDLNRLLVPLLKVLLHPATARSADNLTDSDSSDEDGGGDSETHRRFLYYGRLYDTRRCRHALECLQTIVSSNPVSFVAAAALSAIGQKSTMTAASTLNALLLQHEGSIARGTFERLNSSEMSLLTPPITRNYMDTVLTVLLWFIQSHFRSGVVGDATSVVRENGVIQIAAVDVCRLVVQHLGCAMSSSSIGMASTSGGYIEALFTICGLHRVVLASLSMSLDQVVHPEQCRGVDIVWDDDVNRTYQVRLLQLVFAVLRLEESQNLCWSFADSAITFWRDGTKRMTNMPSSVIPVLLVCPLAQQPKLLFLLLTGIRDSEKPLLDYWLQLVCSALTCLGVVTASALEEIIGALLTLLDARSAVNVRTVLAALAHVCVFCLLDMSGDAATDVSQKSVTFLDFDLLVGLPPLVDKVSAGAQTSNESAFCAELRRARKMCLKLLTRIWSSLISVWEWMVLSGSNRGASVKTIIVQLANFVATQYDVEVLVALAFIWKEMCKENADGVCLRKEALLNLVSSVQTLSLSFVLKSSSKALRRAKESSDADLSGNVLLFIKVFAESRSSEELLSAWSDLYNLLREATLLAMQMPPDLFTAISTLSLYSTHLASLKDRKVRKEAQELTIKMVDTCCTVIAASLESKSWLFRSLVVKPTFKETSADSDVNRQLQENGDSPTHEDEKCQPDEVEEDSKPPLLDRQLSAELSKHSTKALGVLANNLAGLVDGVFGSEEKDRVLSLLNNVMAHVFPFLRCHSSATVASYAASSAVLASVSEYQYTRKAWRKEALELFMDPAFFNTDLDSLKSWNSIVDNLMSQDKTTFKDLLSRGQALSQGGLFTHLDQDIDLKAKFLKRLAFAVFSGRQDQYHRYLPAIQERLSEILRIHGGPFVHEQVFMCFRVLLLRVSPHHLRSFWPIINAELMHVFTQMEQELCVDANQYTLSSEGDGSWMRLCVASCKFIDMPRHVDPVRLPDFEMHRWGFIESVKSGEEAGKEREGYCPYVTNLLDLMNKCPEQQVSLNYEVSAAKVCQTTSVPLLQLKQLLISLSSKSPTVTPSTDYEMDVLKDFIDE